MTLNRWAIPALAALAFVAVPGSALAQADQPVRLAAAGPWALEYAADSCRLVRSFGTGDSAVTIGLTSYAPGGMFQLSAVGELTRPAPSATRVRVALGDVESFDLDFLTVDFGGQPGLVILNPMTVGPLPAGVDEALRASRPVDSFSTPEAEAQATYIGLIDGMVREFVAETGSLRGPIQALKDCTVELVTHWDIDQAAHATRTRIAVPQTPPFRWIEARRYPRALRQPTLINFRLIVDAEGQVADCHVAGLEPTDEFARITCDQLSEIEFSPALDAQGNPVRSYFVSWWVLRP